MLVLGAIDENNILRNLFLLIDFDSIQRIYIYVCAFTNWHISGKAFAAHAAGLLQLQSFPYLCKERVQWQKFGQL